MAIAVIQVEGEITEALVRALRSIDAIVEVRLVQLDASLVAVEAE
jgi:hypothetical protein